jgi:hypothetical protein
MTYKRKTKDIFEIHSDFGYGFEYTCTCDNWRDARFQLRTYRTNQPQYPHKIVKYRERIQDDN